MKAALASAFVLAASLACASAAEAAPKNPQAEAADVLFREALALADQGNIVGACDKFRESEATEHSTGTLMNVARCLEREEKFAEAWKAYARVRDEAKSAPPAMERNRTPSADRVAAAEQRLKSLEAKVGRVRINVEGAPATLVSIEMGGTTYSRETLKSTPPILAFEAGTQRYTLNYQGNRSTVHTKTITAGLESELSIVPGMTEERIVTLPAAPTKTPTTPTPAPEPPGDGMRTAGYVVGGVGVAALATGALFGAMALGKKAAADCPEGKCKTNEAYDAATAGQGLSTVATLAFISGGVLVLGSGAMLFWPRDKTEKGTARLRVVPSGPGLVMAGSF